MFSALVSVLLVPFGPLVQEQVVETESGAGPPATIPLFANLHEQTPFDIESSGTVLLGFLDDDLDLDAYLVGGTDRVLLGDGAAWFVTAPNALPPGTSTSGTRLFDIDRDTDLDVVTYGPVRIFLNDGAGVFADASGGVPSAGGNSCLRPGDVDGDGDEDLVVGTQGAFIVFDGEPLLLRNSGGLVFDLEEDALPAISSSTVDLVVHDFDGDDDLDVFLANGIDPVGIGAAQNLYFANDSKGIFTDVTSSGLPVDEDDTRAVAVGDVDGDDDPDLVLANDGTPNRLYRNVGGLFQDLGGLPVDGDRTARVALADVDDDDDLDIWFGNRTTPDRILLNDGFGVFTELVGALPPVGFNTRLAFGDLDGDSDVDALIASGVRERVQLNDGSGFFHDVTNLLPPDTSGARTVLLADLDDDGDRDLFLADAASNRAATNDGSGGFTELVVPAGSGTPRSLAAEDLDGDGVAEVYLGNEGADQLLANDGSGVLSDASAGLPALSLRTAAVALGDVDDDGDRDVVLGHTKDSGPFGGEANLILSNEGSLSFVESVGALPADVEDTDALVLADLDGDEDLDLAVGNLFGMDRLYHNRGDGFFDEVAGALPYGPVTDCLVALDFDNDGDLDLLQGQNGTAPVLLENQSGAFVDVSSLMPVTAHGLVDAVPCDVDLDGRVDLLATLGTSIGMNLYLNDPGGGFLDRNDLLPADAVRTGALALADVDGDLDPDAILAGAGLLRLWSNRTRHAAWRNRARPGRTLFMDVNGPPLEPWWLMSAPDKGELFLPPWGTLWLDVFSGYVLDVGMLDGDGSAETSFTFAANPALLGQTFYVQPAMGLPLRLGNLETVALLDL